MMDGDRQMDGWRQMNIDKNIKIGIQMLEILQIH